MSQEMNLTLINRISALTKLFSARKTQKITSNLLMALSRNTLMALFLALMVGIADAGAVVNVIVSPVGGNGVCTVSAENIQDAGGIDISFSYDIATLTDPKVTAGPSADGALMDAHTSTPGFVRIAFIGSGTFKESGQLATITFTKVGKLMGSLSDLKSTVYSSSSSQIASRVTIGAPPASTVGPTGNTGGITNINSNNNSRIYTSSNSGDMSKLVDRIQNPQQSGTYLGGMSYPADTASGQQVNRSVQYEQRKEELKRDEPRREERNNEPQPDQAQYATPTATTSVQSDVDKVTATVRSGEALARLKTVVSPVERFRTFKGARTIKSLALLFDVSAAREAGAVQTPAIAISDGKSLLTVRIELAASGIIPNFSLKGANLKSIRPVSDKAWELGALPQQGKNDVSLSVMIGNEQVELLLVVVPPLDAVMIKQTQGLSEEGVGALIAKGGGIRPGKPAYDLNGDGKQDFMDDYILVAGYLRNMHMQEKHEQPKK